MKYKCTVSYDGLLFNGFQIQNNLRTIQGEIEKVLEEVCHEKITICGAGRTDAKVHAVGAVFHFETNLNIFESNMKKAINSLLPEDIYIVNVEKVSDDFHARYSAIKKEYHYLLDLGEYNPLYRNYHYYYPYKKLDIILFKQALNEFVGLHDFKSFTKRQDLENTTRNIYSIDVVQDNDLYTIKIVGDGFLHNMVRIIIAMSLEVGLKKITIKNLQEIMQQHDRKKAPKVAPAHALYLYKVYY